jgi:4-amino-4-deoxy-L-arabinose transferase-like glycosyltransferase
MNKFKAALNEDKFLIIAIIVAFLLRLCGLSMAPFFDENFWLSMVGGMLHGSQPLFHPPMAFLAYGMFALAGGVSVSAFRLMPLCAGLLTIAVSYYFAKSLYGKKTAVITAFLMSVIFYHVWMSLYIDIDGNLLTLFSVMTLFSFHKFESGRDKKWLLLTGLSFGLAMLTKYPAILLVPVIILYDWISNKLGNLKYIAAFAAVGLTVFSLFPLFSFATNSPEMFVSTLEWGGGNIGRTDAENVLYAYILSVGKLVIFLFQYGTPLLCLLPLLLIRKREKKDFILFFYIAMILLFYTLVLPGGAKARYLMPAVPVLAMLSSKSITLLAKKFERRDAIRFACLFFAFLVIIMALNSYGVHESFNSKKMLASLLFENSMFWYSGFASTPFAIHIHSIIFLIAASIVMFLLSFRYGSLLVPIIAIGLAFNFFVVVQSFYPTVGPNFTSTALEMTDYYKTHDLDCKPYSTDKTFTYYLDGVSFIDMTSPPEGIEGCILACDVQDFTKSQNFKDMVSGCEMEKSFYSNGFEFGYIYRCG